MSGRSRRTPEPPEDSISMRVVVAVAVELAIVAVVAQHAVDAASSAAALTLAPVGYWLSYRRRYRANLFIKVCLAVGLLAAMGQFLDRVQAVTTVDEARIPLASLFLWVQMLHAFDVPRRRDLAFSMISSLILMAEAAALSLTTGFLVFLIPWAGLAGAWLFLSSRMRSDRLTPAMSVRRIAQATGRRPRTARARAAATPALAAMMAGFALFLVMPRVPGSLVKTPPFSLNHTPQDVAGFDGGLSNPNLAPADPNGVVNFAPGAYPGLSDVVDLRARGHLSNRIAFLVRASQPALWRAEAFDTYDGATWTIGSTHTQELVPGDAPGSFDLPPRVAPLVVSGLPTVPLTQTFYIEEPQPNVLFGAAAPARVYFPAAGLRVDPYGSIRSPILLEQGMVYSVVSEVPVADSRLLRLAGTRVPAAAAAELQLPASLPTRVRDLARTVARSAPTEFDKVQAVQTWIQRHTRYDLNVPADPPGVDEVDHFLFVTRRGFCEQIASSMAVMLRTLGIPARLVTGFGPGTRNPLTGYFEVHDSDAHAWVEVYYPNLGWVPYDPTFGVPEADPGVSSRFMAAPVFAAIGRFLAHVTPAPVKHAVGAVWAVLRDTAHVMQHGWPVALAIVATSGLVLLGWGRWRRRRLGPAAQGAERAFIELTRALEPAGHARPEHVTPGEYLSALSRDPSLDAAIVAAAEQIVRSFERERFSPHVPADAEVARVQEQVLEVRRLMRPRLHA